MQEILDLDPLSVSDDRLSGVRCYDDSTNLLPELKSFIVYNKLLATEEEPMSDGNDARLLTGSELSGGGIRKNLTTDEEKVLGIVSNRFPVSFSSGGGSARNTSRTTFSSFGGGNFPCLQDLIISSSNTVGETDKQNPRDQISSDEYEEETNDYVDGDNEFILDDEDLYDIGPSVQISSGGGNRLKDTRSVSFSDDLLPNPSDQNSSGEDDDDDNDDDDEKPTASQVAGYLREIKQIWKERDAERTEVYYNKQNSLSWRASLAKKEPYYSNKDELILSLRNDLAQSQKKTAQLEKALGVHSCQAERTQRRLECSLAERESEMDTLRLLLAERESEVETLRSSLTKRDEQLISMTSEMADKDRRIEWLKGECCTLEISASDAAQQHDKE